MRNSIYLSGKFCPENWAQKPITRPKHANLWYGTNLTALYAILVRSYVNWNLKITAFHDTILGLLVQEEILLRKPRFQENFGYYLTTHLSRIVKKVISSPTLAPSACFAGDGEVNNPLWSARGWWKTKNSFRSAGRGVSGEGEVKIFLKEEAACFNRICLILPLHIIQRDSDG